MYSTKDILKVLTCCIQQRIRPGKPHFFSDADKLLPVLLGVALFCVIPATAFQLGSDEGYELMKAWLVYNGYENYREIWNDQPPLYTYGVAGVFVVFGVKAAAARCLTLFMAVTLLMILYDVIRSTSGRIAAMISLLLLTSSNSFLSLSSSAMLEIPAFSLGMAGVWFAFNFQGRSVSLSLSLSAIAFALALQVKLTAILVFPAVLVAFYYSSSRKTVKSTKRNLSKNLCLGIAFWGTSVVLAFGLTAYFLYPTNPIEIFWRSHVSGISNSARNQMIPKWGVLLSLNDFPITVIGLIGFGILAWKKREMLLVPGTLFITALLSHTFYSQHWYYYRIHFSIPLAWIGAAGTEQLLRYLDERKPIYQFSNGVKACLLSFISYAFIGITALQKIYAQLYGISSAPLANENSTVALLESQTQSGRWVFTHETLAAFWANRLVPPNLAVMPLKRFWSNQITSSEVISELERFQAESILIPEEWKERLQLDDYLKTAYLKKTNMESSVLYIRSDLGRKGFQRNGVSPE